MTLLLSKKNKGQQTHLNFTAFSEEAETEGILNSNSADGTCFGVGVIGASFSIMSSCLVHDFRAVPRLLPGCSLHVVVV